MMMITNHNYDDDDDNNNENANNDDYKDVDENSQFLGICRQFTGYFGQTKASAVHSSYSNRLVFYF